MSAVVGQEDGFAAIPAVMPAVSVPAVSAPAVRAKPATRPAGQWPLSVVIGLLFVGLAVTLVGTFRTGSLVLATAVATAFALRMVLPQKTAGMLASRRRFVDLIVLGSMAGALATVALSVPA